jgi:hypothetical protein
MSVLPRLMPRWPVVLRSSSACWQRQLARPVARSAAATRACAWIADFVAIPRPRLQPEPLWGSCLEQMLAGGERPSTTPSPKRTMKPSPTHSLPPPQASKPAQRSGARAGNKALPDLPTHSARPDLPRVPGPKMGQLLRQLARTGEAGPPAGRVGRAGHQPRAKKPRVAAGWSGRPEQPTTTVPARLPATAQAVVAWQEKMVRGVARQLRRARSNQVSLATPPVELSAIPVDGVALWQRPLHGPGVSRSLLQQLAQPGAAAASKQQAAPLTRRQPENVLPTRDMPPVAAGSDQPQMATQLPILPAQQPLLPPATAKRQPGALSTTDATSPNRAGATPANEAVAPQVSPPQATPLLPSLRPLPNPAGAEPTAAREAAWRSAQRESKTSVVGHGPDYGRMNATHLARQLKQILDEEARRHGIDI